jgi:hypothetical protein
MASFCCATGERSVSQSWRSRYLRDDLIDLTKEVSPGLLHFRRLVVAEKFT